MEGRLGEHLEDKLFFHYPHLDNTAKDYSWIAAPVVISFMVVVVVVVVMVVVMVRVAAVMVVIKKVYCNRKPRLSVSTSMRYVLT